MARMPYNLLLFPLLGGFLFLHLNNFFRFHAQRVDGYRLLVESAIAGTVLGVFARLVVHWTGCMDIGIWAGEKWPKLFPWEHADTAAWAVLLGPILALAINVVVDRETAKRWEVHRHGNTLTRFLYCADQEGDLISISLLNRKWYVGLVAEAPNLSPHELYFRILPLMSGYRDKDTLEAVPTTFYSDALNDPARDSEDFVVTIPLKDVQTANLFDIDFYQKYFVEDIEENDPADETASSAESKDSGHLATQSTNTTLSLSPARISYTQEGGRISLTIENQKP